MYLSRIRPTLNGFCTLAKVFTQFHVLVPYKCPYKTRQCSPCLAIACCSRTTASPFLHGTIRFLTAGRVLNGFGDDFNICMRLNDFVNDYDGHTSSDADASLVCYQGSQKWLIHWVLDTTNVCNWKRMRNSGILLPIDFDVKPPHEHVIFWE